MRGILFKPDMIKAIVEDRKTQTRRVIKPQPPEGYDYISKMEAWVKPISDIKVAMVRTAKPRYQVGEVVYIKEAFWEDSGDIYYKMDFPNGELPTNMFFEKGKWKSPLFLPEIFARYFIQITSVRAERLQEITNPEAKTEGVLPDDDRRVLVNALDKRTHRIYIAEERSENYREAFERLWDSINKPPYDWQSNPWVWVYSFKEVDKDVDL